MISDLLPPFPHLTVEQITRSEAVVALCLRSTRDSAFCPRCRCPSHSSYGWFTRRVQATSCFGREVVFVLHGRRFRCRNAACPCRTFREDFAPLVRRYQRRTQEVTDVLRQIARVLGGHAGARIAQQVQLKSSSTTLLRLVKQAPTPSPAPPRLIGVDAFAWKKGQRYGTIIVDHEAHTVLAILPDREVPKVAAWLREYPSICIC